MGSGDEENNRSDEAKSERKDLWYKRGKQEKGVCGGKLDVG